MQTSAAKGETDRKTSASAQLGPSLTPVDAQSLTKDEWLIQLHDMRFFWWVGVGMSEARYQSGDGAMTFGHNRRPSPLEISRSFVTTTESIACRIGSALKWKKDNFKEDFSKFQKMFKYKFVDIKRTFAQSRFNRWKRENNLKVSNFLNGSKRREIFWNLGNEDGNTLAPNLDSHLFVRNWQKSV